MDFGSFISPDAELEKVERLAEHLSIPIYSGHRAVRHVQHLLKKDPLFDRVVEQVAKVPLEYEDQCSAEYYFDLVRTISNCRGKFDRVVEVGVFMGGSSTILAGCMKDVSFELDLVDINPVFLQFTYERIRRTFPESVSQIRLFYGDVTSYVRAALKTSIGHKYIVHHDGAHDFNQVVKDLCAISFARDQIFAIIAQDTHLRGSLKYMNFVDMALYAVFGLNLDYEPIGSRYPIGDSRTAPDKYYGNYFLPGAPEGFVIPMATNSFRYPHPDAREEDFL